MKALVTGAAGFIGSRIAARLAADGNEVLGLDDLSEGSLDNLRDVPSVAFIEADLRDAAAGHKSWSLGHRGGLVRFQERRNIPHCPQAVGDAGLHRGRAADGLVEPDENHLGKAFLKFSFQQGGMAMPQPGPQPPPPTPPGTPPPGPP